jgi:hypothetical protein
VDGYHVAHHGCRVELADFNADGAVDGLDIQLFVNALIGG